MTSTHTVLHDAADGMMSCIARIMCAKDRPSVESAIQAVEEINLRVANETHTEPADIRRMLREGIGIFAPVAGKAKRMGVV